MNLNDRPRINIEKDTLDHIIIGVGWIGWIALILMPIFYYSELPEEIPRHYGLDGQADAWSGKSVIWSLPMIGSILFFGLLILRRFPHILNYPTKITAENAEQQYRMAGRILSITNTLMVLAFSYITFASIQNGLGRMDGLGSWFLPVFVGLILLSIAYYLYQMLAIKRK